MVRKEWMEEMLQKQQFALQSVPAHGPLVVLEHSVVQLCPGEHLPPLVLGRFCVLSCGSLEGSLDYFITAEGHQRSYALLYALFDLNRTPVGDPDSSAWAYNTWA